MAALGASVGDIVEIKGVNLQVLADSTEGCTGADLSAICNRAALIAIREYLATRKSESKDYSGFIISKKHVDEARKLLDGQRK